nr:AraC family transcriptional regulator [Pseudomaricurvus alkylphenolicus]
MDADQLLELAGIAPDLLNAARARVPTEKVSALVHLIWSGLNDENMGLSSHPIKPGNFHMMGKLCVHAPTLGKALHRGIEYYRLVQDDFQITLKETDETATIQVDLKRPELDEDNLLTELLILTWHRIASWLIDEQIVLKETRFSYPAPSRVDEYRYLFPCIHRFDQAVNSFSFNPGYLERPVVQSHESLKAFIAGCPTNLFVLYRQDNSLATRVRQVLEPHASHSMPGLDAVAGVLGMSKYALRQRLKEEGTSYQKIKNIVRRDMAIYFLTQVPPISVGEIALKVGYSEPGDFVRAFKGWTGVPPGQYRRS